MSNMTVSGDEEITQAGVASSGFPEKVTDVYITGLIPSIGSSAFMPCQSLQRAFISSPVTIIGASAFEKITSFTEIHLGNSMKTLATACFQRSSLHEVTFPACLEEIYPNAFSWNPNFVSVTIPPDSKLKFIRPEGFYQTNLASIYLPEGFHTLDSGALRWTNISSLHLPSTLTSIAYLAFGYCYHLTKLTINASNTVYQVQNNVLYRGTTIQLYPAGLPTNADLSFVIPDFVKEVGQGSFEGNTRITKVTFGSSCSTVASNGFKRCVSLKTLVNYDKLTSLGNQAFDNTSLTTFAIPLTMTGFGAGIFTNCGDLTITVAENHPNLWVKPSDGVIYTKDVLNLVYIPTNLVSVVIEPTVTSIPESFFIAAKNLESITLPRDVVNIWPYAFQLRNLKSITIPKNCKIIWSQAFSGASSLKTLTFEDGSLMNDIYNEAFTETGLETINFGAGTTLRRIGYKCFARSSKLLQITIPDSVKIIDYNAFEDCSSLTSLSLTGNIETMGEKVFIGTQIATINFNIAKISFGAFQQMSALQTVNFGSKVTVIEPQAFQSCPKLDTIVYDPQCIITEIGGYSFAYCLALTSVTIPASVTSLAPNSFSFSENLETIEVNSGNTKYESIGGLVYSKGLDSMIICPAGKITVTINVKTTTIQEMGFYGCKKMTEIEMGGNIVEIAKQSFWGCSSLQVVTIPSKIQKIGKEAFKECDLLSTIFYCADLGNIEHEDDPFPDQTKIYVPSTYMKSDFIGHPIIKSSSIRPDGCPNVPSMEFTKKKKNKKPLFFISKVMKQPIVIGALTMIVNNL